ncbi:MAG: hypothetical protein R2729_06880 [Bryobacteraceae bacterium]
MSVRQLLPILSGSLLLLQAAAPTHSPPPLIGRWTNGQLSPVQYRDAYHGSSRPPSGDYFAYEFRPDGTYSYVGMLQLTMKNCTTLVFTEENGVYEVGGPGQIALRPRTSPFHMVNSCSPGSNREGEGRHSKRTLRFAIKGDSLTLTSITFYAVSTGTQAFERERRQ